jgi:uncharacterized protein YxjI
MSRRREERKTFGAHGDATRYKMRQKLFAIGDDYWIEDGHGQRVFKIDGKALRIRQTLLFEDRKGTPLCEIQEQMLHVRDTMDIEDTNGHKLAAVKKALVNPMRDHWTIQRTGKPDLHVRGNIMDHEYKIHQDQDVVAEVSKRWFRVSDTYGVEIAPAQNDVLILAATVVLDEMAHAGSD